jgi:DNA polymerase-3 subunit delta
VGKRSLIELSDVETSVAETTQRTIFELTDALGERNVHRAVQMLANVIDHGQAPVMILAMIARHFRILLKAKEVAGRISNPAEIARYLGVHPFFAKQYADQANNFSLNELKDNFAKLSECDRELKSSRLSRLRILEHLVMEILHKKKAA